MKISVKISGPRWVHAEFSEGGREVAVEGSCLSDAIADLLQATRLMVSGSQDTSCRWQNEPGETRLSFHREVDRVRIQVATYDSSFSRSDDRSGVVAFEGSESVHRTGVMVKQQFDRILYELGEGGYLRIWGRPFPSEELKRLADALDVCE